MLRCREWGKEGGKKQGRLVGFLAKHKKDEVGLISPTSKLKTSDFFFLNICQFSFINVDFHGSSVGKESTCNVGDADLTPGSGRSLGEGHGNPLQYSCLENPMDRGARRATVHGVAKSWTWLRDWTATITAHGSLVPQPGIQRRPPALEGRVLNTPLGQSQNITILNREKIYFILTSLRNLPLPPASNFQIHELSTHTQLGFPSGSDIKEDACNIGDPGCILGLRDSPGEGNGNALWCSCLENCVDRRKWVCDSPWGHQESDTTGWLMLDTVTSLSSQKLSFNRKSSSKGLVPLEGETKKHCF